MLIRQKKKNNLQTSPKMQMVRNKRRATNCHLDFTLAHHCKLTKLRWSEHPWMHHAYLFYHVMFIVMDYLSASNLNMDIFDRN